MEHASQQFRARFQHIFKILSEKRERFWDIAEPAITPKLESAQNFVRKISQQAQSLSLPALLLIGSGITLLLVIAAVITYFSFVSELATPEQLMNKNNTGLILMDRAGKSFFKQEQAREIKIYPIANMPKYVPQAFIAIEDDQFYNHPGFSIRGISRAVIANFRNTGYSQGGSTITQQLVKNALLTSEKTLTRKYQELILSLEIERRYSKNEILEMYLNSIYFGSGAYGIEEASQTYFDKDVSQLTVAEAAILASLPKAPSSLTPFGGDRKRLFERQALILEKLGYDPGKESEVTFAEPKESTQTSLAPHFAVWLRDYLYQKYGEDTVDRLGFRVVTTIDRSMQETGETLVKQHIANLGRRDATNAGIVSINPQTGEILTMVGSVDWNNEEFGKYNIAFANRQPGSTFKPIVYAEAFTKGKHPSDIIKDEPINIAGYEPRNSDGTFRGDITIREALGNSLNIPAVKLLEFVGVKNAINLAHDMGITSLSSDQDFGLSLVLGGGEVQLFEITRAYGVFATSGELVPSHPILEITDKLGNVIYRYRPQTSEEEEFLKSKEPFEAKHIGGTKKQSVLDSAVAYLVTAILSDNDARKATFGESNWLTLGRPAAAKTGTTNDFKDAWTIGYTPDIVTGVWVGNNDGSPMSGLFGSQAAAPIWHGFMLAAHKGKETKPFEKPSSLVEVKICKTTRTFCTLCIDEDTYVELYSKRNLPAENCSQITPTPTITPTPEPTNTPAPTNTPIPTTIPTNTPIPSPTVAATAAPTPVLSPLITPPTTPIVTLIPTP
ncbi:PBP1A family penicillin-binding protein [Candidatus Woesebacteria bacterium]|nr:PBP1A family penicillin-binding protein [Candidatus Woesebacteria bacterium]